MVNDQLHIGKSGKSVAADKSAAARTLAAAATAAASQPNAAAASAVPQDAQMEMVMRFMEGSGLVRDVAVQCLESNNWNFDLAVADFTRLKVGKKLTAVSTHTVKETNQIPPEYYVQ